MAADLPAVLEPLIDESAAPAWCRQALLRLGDVRPEAMEVLAASPDTAAAAVAVIGISNALTRVMHTDPGALDVLGALDEVVSIGGPGPAESMVGRKDRELLRIAARDQLGIDDLEATTAALSTLGDDVLLESAARSEAPENLVIITMGKLGARELNYASDLDVVFVCGDDVALTEATAAAARLLEVAGQCFRIDVDLRPEGRNGPLVRSRTAHARWFEAHAEAWEFQALLKARPLGGTAIVRSEVAAALDHLLWSRPFTADDLRSLRLLKSRAEHDVPATAREREVKRSPGGLRDVEFTVQLLQLVHGRNDPALREPRTLSLLAELGEAGYVDGADAATLAEAYRFWRRLEHRLQLVEGRESYALPSGHEPRLRLGRAMGWRDGPDGDAADQLTAAVAATRTRVRSVHERVYFRPLLDAFAGAGHDGTGGLSAAAATTRLTAFGFRDAERTRQAIDELTKGLTRSSRLMQQLLPLMLEWLADSPDPDQGLLGLRTLAAGARRSGTFTNAFRDNPEGARRLCRLVGTSELLTRQLHRNPDLAAALADDERLRPRGRARLVERGRTALSWRRDPSGRQQALKRLTEREGLRIGAADVLGVIEATDVGPALSRLAEAALESALEALSPTVPIAAVALGRFGGAELSYASDLDLVVVYEGDDERDAVEAQRVATELLGFLRGATPARRIYDIDTDLRPEGRSGPLTRTVESYVAHFERWGETWERHAHLRGRPVAGDRALGQRLLDELAPAIWGAPFGEAEARELRRMKARIERERIPAGDDARFHLKLGPGALSDVEWTVQLLQLGAQVRSPSTLTALDLLVDAGALDRTDADVLTESYRFCDRTRNRWHLVKGTAADSLPVDPDGLRRLSRSLEMSPSELREHYRRVTRRARGVVERLFYGAT